MIGIIGYGMVGKAVEYGFAKTQSIISDPRYNQVTVRNVCEAKPDAIFVCVPTPTDDTNYQILVDVLNQIQECQYNGLTVVKSTILPRHLEGYDVLFNPEFLSRATSFQDFVSPPLLVVGGDVEKANRLVALYNEYSIVSTDHVFVTDIKTASLVKYSFNTFYATKVTFMNSLYDVAKKMNVEYNELINIIKVHPWVGGLYHLQVPGPDGKRGFGGPCLPKDTEALAKEFNVEFLHKVLELNKHYRDK